MKLQTLVPFKKADKNLINYNSKIFLIGSCFSKNIGDKFTYFKFQSTQNPLGILFHPIAIENLVKNAVQNTKYSKSDLILENDLWHSFDAHSSCSSKKETEVLFNLNSAISATNKNLKEASHIIFTLGTAWIYRFIKSDKIVANCHKIPQKQFSKELLSIHEIIESLENCIALIKSINKDITILFTVSPVRHLKNGFIENTLSKSHLLAAIHKVIETKNNTYYFPSYEIMMDELRDYRFYTEDMIHPSAIAINYIWEKFKKVWFSEENFPLMKEIDTIQKGINHKPLNINSAQYQNFLENLNTKKQQIKNQLDFIEW